jgi:hypothetical protein
MPPTHARRLERSRAVPRHPRRVSGPARPPRADHAAQAAAVAAGTLRTPQVATGAVAAPRPRRAPGTSSFERIRALPDHRVVDRLLRGRACIWLIGMLLGGIVAMQVSLLKLNSGISRAVETTATLQRQNADMQADIARLASGERVRAAAVGLGMVDPAAGDVRYLHVRPRYDAGLAVMRMRAPSETAKAVMANGGREPGLLASPLVAAGTATTSAASSTITAAPVTTTAPTTTTTTAPTTSTATTPTTTTVPTTGAEG